MKFVDYGYVSSTYSSQGKTSDYVIGILRAKEKFLNLRMNYYLELFLILDQKYQVIIKKVRLIQSLKDLTLLQMV